MCYDELLWETIDYMRNYDILEKQNIMSWLSQDSRIQIKGMKMTGLDSYAFPFLSLVICGLSLAVLLWLIIKRITQGTDTREYNLVKHDPLFKTLLRPPAPTHKGLLLMILLALLTTAATIVSYQNTIVFTERNTLRNPHKLLGVNSTSTIGQIRKSYRNLALQLHPDRNSQNAAETERFIAITSAYHHLLQGLSIGADDQADTSSSSQVLENGIAFPKFLMEPKYQYYILIGILACLSVTLLGLFRFLDKTHETRCQRGVLTTNQYLIYRMLVCGPTYASIVKAMAQMKEVEDSQLAKIHFRIKPAINPEQSEATKEEDTEDLNQPELHLPDIPMTQSCIRNLSAFSAYITKENKYDPFLQQLPSLIHSVVHFSLDFCTRSPLRRQVLSPGSHDLIIPFVGAGVLQHCISLSQSLFQNNEPNLNGINSLDLSVEVEAALGPEVSVRQLIEDQPSRRLLLSMIQSPDRRMRINQQLSHLPRLRLEVETHAGCTRQSVFTTKDVIFFEFHVLKNATHGVSYIPQYGYLRREKFWLTMQLGDELVYFEEILFDPDQIYHQSTYSYRETQVGELLLTVHLRTDCYFGLDLQKHVRLKVVEAVDQGVSVLLRPFD